MATPEANLPSARSSDVARNLNNGMATSRSSQNFNAFQLVSQLVSATPPYLFNMTSPFPGNFFSDLLRRMAPRAGTPSLSLDVTLQQHIRAALLTKSTPHPAIPPNPLHPHMDLASLVSQQRHNIAGSTPEKGLKRPLFADITSANVRDEVPHKRPRLEEKIGELRKSLTDGLTSPFMLQSPFLPSSVPPTPEMVSHWHSNQSLIRPQLPIPGAVSAGPFDPYRMLLDLRLAGQLHSMAASQSLHHQKDPSATAHTTQIPPPSSMPTPIARSCSPSREVIKPKEEPAVAVGFSHNGTLRVDNARVSAFHPPTTGRVAADVGHDEQGDNRSVSSNSNSSCNSASRESLGPQYIFKHLNEIYRSIDHHQKPGEPEEDDRRNDGPSDPIVGAVIKKCKDENNAIGTDAAGEQRDRKPTDFRSPHAGGPSHPRAIFANVNGYPETTTANFQANITIKSSDASEQSLDRG